MKNQNLPKDFIFVPTALSITDGYLTFYSPENESNVSYTAIPNGKSKAETVKCECLKTISQNLKHNTIDLLKMDIEGFEYDVLKNIIEENIRPKQLLIEFHHFFPEIGNIKTEEMIFFLEKNGYRLYNVADSFCEYAFVFDK